MTTYYMQSSHFINAVESGFYSNPNVSEYAKSRMRVWGISNFIKDKSSDINSRAKDILDHSPNLNVSTQKRYRSNHNISYRDKLISAIFKRSFEYRPEEIIRLAQRLSPKKGDFYPLWKRVVFIDIPKLKFIPSEKAKAIFMSLIAGFSIGIPIGVTTTVLTLTYNRIISIAAKTIPFIVNNTPLKALKVVNLIGTAFDTFLLYRPVILLVACVFKYCIDHLKLPRENPGELKVLSYFRKFQNEIKKTSYLSIAVVLFPESATLYIIKQSVLVGWQSLQYTYAKFQQITQQVNLHERERLTVCYDKSFEVWKQCCAER